MNGKGTDLYSMYNNFDGMGLCEVMHHSINCVITVGEIIVVAAAVAAADAVAADAVGQGCVRFWLGAILVVDAVASDAAGDGVAGAGAVDATAEDCSIV